MKFNKIELKDNKIKKLISENQKLLEDAKRLNPDKAYQSAYADSKSNDTEYLRRQVRILEDKLKRQRPAEKPYDTVSNVS